MRLLINIRVLSDAQARKILSLLASIGLENLDKHSFVELDASKDRWLELRRIEEENDLPYTFLTREG